MSETATAPKLDAIVERYIKLRDLKAQHKQEYEKKVAEIDGALDRIENFFLKTMNEQGSESIKTPFGTAYISEKTNATVADWDSVSNFIREDIAERWGMLERRVAKGFVEQYRSEHNDLPPGINWTVQRAVNFRRA
jgi:hypothetical protein